MGLFLYINCALLALCSVQAEDDVPQVRMNFGLPEGNLLDLYKNKVGKKPKLVAFNYENCGSDNDKLRLKQLQITPSANGDVVITFAGETDIDIVPPIQVDLDFHKDIFGVMVPLPCFKQIGSCHYDDFCTFGLEKCPFPALDQNHIPCQCPIKKGLYTINMGSFPVPRMPTADLLKGSYKGKVLVKNAKNELLACYNGTATLDAIEVP